MTKKILKLLRKLRQKTGKIYSKIEAQLLLITLNLITKESVIRLPSSLDGYYNFKTSNRFFKIVFRKKIFFEEEKSSIEFIKNNFPEIGKIIPEYQYLNLCQRLVLVRISELMNPLEQENEEYKAATDFLTIFRKNSHTASIKITDLIYVEKGLEILQKLVGSKTCKNFKDTAENFLKNNSFAIGLCHGDFHSKNFMKSGDRNFLIDFDCVRENSIQELDAIYFIVQKIVDDNPEIWWHEAIMIAENQILQNPKYRNFLENFIDLKQVKNLITLFFIDRIGQDVKYLGSVSKCDAKAIVAAVKDLDTAAASYS